MIVKTTLAVHHDHTLSSDELVDRVMQGGVISVQMHEELASRDDLGLEPVEPGRTIDPVEALTLGIWAINTLLEPDASRAEDAARLDALGEQAVATLADAGVGQAAPGGAAVSDDLRKRPDETREEYIARIVDAAPPASPELAARLARLLPMPKEGDQ